jgi:hypothetical protein
VTIDSRQGQQKIYRCRRKKGYFSDKFNLRGLFFPERPTNLKPKQPKQPPVLELISVFLGIFYG